MIIRKHKIRELAMQILYLWDANAGPDPDLARQVVNDASDDEKTRETALETAANVWNHREIADRWVGRLAPQWPVHRQPPIDRNLLRLAVWEMINTTTPPQVVIDEAIELAKQFSTDQSAAFINGVLDAILKEHRNLTSTDKG